METDNYFDKEIALANLKSVVDREGSLALVNLYERAALCSGASKSETETIIRGSNGQDNSLSNSVRLYGCLFH